MNIVYFGSDVFLPCFEYIAEHHNIMALYTYHNDEDYFTEFEITKRAKELGIPIHYEAVSPEKTKAYFKNGCDLYFVAEYDRIIEIPEDLPVFRGTNIHSSALPEGRSYYPIEAAMDLGLKRTGVTVHKLKPLLDSGEIIAQRVFDITDDMDSVDVYLNCAAYAVDMTKNLLSDFKREWDAAKTQTKKLPYWKRPASEFMTITRSMTAEQAKEVFRRYNSLTEVEIGGARYYVKSLMTGKAKLYNDTVRVSENIWLYKVSNGHLRLNLYPLK